MSQSPKPKRISNHLLLWTYRIIGPLIYAAQALRWWHSYNTLLNHGDNRANYSGRYPQLPPKKPSTTRIWIQAVSVGESQSVSKLIKVLTENNKNLEIIFTTSNASSHKIIQSHYQQNQQVYCGLFPIDNYFCMQRAYKSIQPKLILLVDSELWPEQLTQAKQHSCSVWLINQRHSEKTYRKFAKLPWLQDFLYQHIERVFCSTREDMQQLQKSKMNKIKLEYYGNLKCDNLITPTAAEYDAYKKYIGFDDNTIIIMGVSTWPGEEQVLMQALLRLRQSKHNIGLVLAPRHPKRKAEIIAEADNLDLPIRTRSSGDAAQPNDAIFLIDTLGELAKFLAHADLAFIGKSSHNHHGGQSPIEAAACSAALVFGPNTQNFSGFCHDLERCGAAKRASDSDSIIQSIIHWATHPKQRQYASDQAYQWYQSQKGCCEKIATAIQSTLA